MSKPKDRFRMTVEYTVEPSDLPNTITSERGIIKDGKESLLKALNLDCGVGSIRKITVEKVR